MTIAIRHRLTSAISDAAASGYVKPSHWNDTHSISMAAGSLLGNSAGIAGNAEELAVNVTDFELSGAAFALKATGATAGTYTNPYVTVDSKGRISSISNGPSTSGSTAGAEYLLGTADATLPNARLPTATATVSWDVATANQFKANVVDDSITFAKLQNITTDRLLGRDTAASGDPEEISLVAPLEFNGSQGVRIADDGISNTLLRNSGALSVIGRSANSAGDPADISAVAASDAVLRESGSVIGFGTVATGGIANDAVTFAKMQNIATDRLLGRDTAASGDVEEISVTNGLEFTGGPGIGIANDGVTFARMQNITTDRLIGRDTAASGDPEEISLNATLEFTGSASIQRAALTGAIAASAGSNTTTATVDLVFIIGNGTETITTGVKGFLPIDFACTITQWTLVADASGSIVIDVWKDTYANFPPTVADTIAGTEKPTLSSAQKNQDTSLSTWTTSVAAGDVLGFNVDSITTCKQVTLTIKVTKTS